MARASRSVLLVVFLVLPAAHVLGQEADTPEPGSREAIAAATTEPRFLSPWVASVPDDATVPSPADVLGHVVGAPGELSRTAQIYGYYRTLAAASDRVRVDVIGHSEEGREILLVIVGDAATIADLERLRADMASLADPRRTDEAAMEGIVARARPLYMLHGGLHSTETGSPEMLMELVYRLAVSEAPEIRLVRDKVVVLVNPVAEPDGRDRAVDWFYRHLKGKTDYDALPPHSPPYWGKYVFHDNNRDGVQRRLALTRATQDAFLKWHPVVVHDLHESIPLLSIWTGTGPYNAHLDPITTTE
ncbi:MAG TPA: M14 family zinc carboxypeptidase, partial [Vicinamibacteria bacterium]